MLSMGPLCPKHEVFQQISNVSGATLPPLELLQRAGTSWERRETRSEYAPLWTAQIDTLGIVGLDASNMPHFLDQLER